MRVTLPRPPKARLKLQIKPGIRLLQKFGAAMVDNRLSLPRSALVAEIEAVRSGASYAAFLHTRAAVHKQIRDSSQERAKREFRVPPHPAAP